MPQNSLLERRLVIYARLLTLILNYKYPKYEVKHKQKSVKCAARPSSIFYIQRLIQYKFIFEGKHSSFFNLIKFLNK